MDGRLRACEVDGSLDQVQGLGRGSGKSSWFQSIISTVRASVVDEWW